MKATNSDLERLEELESSIRIDAMYVFDTCKKMLDETYGKNFSIEHPELLSALINSSIQIFIHKPRKK